MGPVAPASAAAMAWLSTLALMNCGRAPRTVRIRFMFDSCWRLMGKRWWSSLWQKLGWIAKAGRQYKSPNIHSGMRLSKPISMSSAAT